jgi:hypothetical protein
LKSFFEGVLIFARSSLGATGIAFYVILIVYYGWRCEVKFAMSRCKYLAHETTGYYFNIVHTPDTEE